MIQIVADRGDEVQAFLNEKIGRGLPWGQYATLAIVRDGELLAGVLYNNFVGTSVSMTVAARSRVYWLTPEVLFHLSYYPFVQLDVNRVTCSIREDNWESQRVCSHAGFTLEGRLREALPGAKDELVYGMLKRECKWLSKDFCGKLARKLQNGSKLHWEARLKWHQ